MVVPGAAAGGGGAAPPPRDETLEALRSPAWAAGGEPRKMVAMTQGCCRFGSSRNTFAGHPHWRGSGPA